MLDLVRVSSGSNRNLLKEVFFILFSTQPEVKWGKLNFM